MKQALTGINDLLYGTFIPETLKYWVGVQQGQSYLMGRKGLSGLDWPPRLFQE